MALTDEINELAENIVPASPGETPEQDEFRAIAVVNVENLLNKVMPHIQDKGEIKVSNQSDLASFFGAGFPVVNDGGAAIQTAQTAAVNADDDANNSEGTIT